MTTSSWDFCRRRCLRCRHCPAALTPPSPAAGLLQQVRPQLQRPQRSLPCRAGKGFGSSSSGGGSGSGSTSGGGSERDKLQDAVRESRQAQLSTSDMLAKLLQADDPKKAGMAGRAVQKGKVCGQAQQVGQQPHCCSVCRGL